VIPLHADYKPVVTSTRPSLAYKSRRRRLKRGKKKGARKKTEGERGSKDKTDGSRENREGRA
jgi:hypothetical protein